MDHMNNHLPGHVMGGAGSGLVWGLYRTPHIRAVAVASCFVFPSLAVQVPVHQPGLSAKP